MNHLAERIRDAFASDEFVKGQRLWTDYAGQLQEAITAGTASKDMLSEARQLIDWCALRVKVHKAHAAGQFTQLYLAGRYGYAPMEPEGAVRVCF